MLNQMMMALELPLTYENEERISGIFYLIEIDDQKAHVSWDEIERKLAIEKEAGLLE